MKKHILQENYERFFGKREFGDPLPTFEDVMEKHQVNKLNEDWWDNMSPEDQAEYIKAHPTSQKAQSSKEKEEPKGKRSDRYADIDTSWMDDPDAVAAQGSPGYTTDDNWGREKGYGQPGHKSYEYIPKSKDDSEGDFPKDPDDIDDLPDDEDDYDMGVVPGSRELDDTPEDDSEKGSSLTSAPGRRPGGEQAEKDYQKADQMIKKYAGVDIEKAEFWAKKKKQASDAMVGEITINGKKYKPITESIRPTIYDPHKEIKRVWKNISSRQFDRKWKKEII